MDSIDSVIRAGNKAKLEAERQKRYYYDIRLKTIAFLGGTCKHDGCDESDPSKLEIHHIHPHQNGGWKCKPGYDKIRFWKNILAGKEQGELYCSEHHISDGHNGNTSDLKGGK